nr:hypothetical protein [uncultured Helicobacter sp.]
MRVLESPDSSSQNKPSYVYKETALRLFSKEIHKLTDSIDNATFLSSALLKQAQSPSLLESRANLSYTLALQSQTKEQT